ncbi:DNA-binding NarL/FixJ family response regulator [Nonomuraea endophytica]|uniref:DNA-binding NarL/FixJ family response regulator n=1 Tax=Nonomuraea endophytica TaxID=714136 RepID=A0A7W8EIR8_9ACTN|nr:DNA-binding NarL/FixJ family response regulator [Nonomuraea endophytica]
MLDGLDLGFAADRTREPRPLTRRALYALAADYFAASAPQVLGEEDMIRRLAEVEMRLAGGERDKAGEVMAWLDTTWSHEQRANPWLAQLRARVPMEDDYLDVQNLSSRAMTLLNQDDPDTAIDDLEEAIEICLRPDLLLHLSACDLAIQLGGAHLQRGDCATAGERYTYALDEAEEGDLHLLAGQARGGLVRCLYEHGKFKDALREYKRAKAHLDRGDEPGATGSSLVLELAHAAVVAATGRLGPAEEVLDQGRRKAGELGQRHLTGAFIGQRATLCLDMGRPGRARELATHVLDLGMQMNNVPLRREAAIVLAQAYLGMDGSADSLRAAQAAANHAVLRPDDAVTTHVRALAAGAVAAVPRDVQPSAVRATVESVVAGRTVLPIDVLRGLTTPGAVTPPEAVPPSPRELGWLRELSTGATVADVADRAGYSERMMFRLLRELYTRMRAGNRTEALLLARERGWL